MSEKSAFIDSGEVRYIVRHRTVEAALCKQSGSGVQNPPPGISRVLIWHLRLSEDEVLKMKCLRQVGNARYYRFEIGLIDFDCDTFHDQVERKHDASAPVITQHDALHPRQRTAQNSHSLADSQERVRRRVIAVQPAAKSFNFTGWQRGCALAAYRPSKGYPER